MPTSLDPEAAKLLAMARQAYAGGDRHGSARLAQQVLLRSPRNAGALQILGVIGLDTGDFASARRHLETALATEPNGTTFNLLGVAARKVGDVDAARSAFERAGEMGLIDGWRNLAVLESGHTQAQADAYRHLLALAPNDVSAHAGLAQALEQRHELARAKEHANTALQLDPAHANARLVLVRLLMREQDFAGAALAASAVVGAPRATSEQRIVALGLMGDARDRAGDTRGAFEAFTAANQLTLRLHGGWLDATDRLYHPESLARMAAMLASSDAGAWGVAAAPSSSRLTFLVGFPRSGTTLLDQILSSHSRIVCLEESEHLSDALTEVINDHTRAVQPASLSTDELMRIRESYWRRTQASDDALVVDKFPLNIVVLPLIKRVFPDAKIIFALRDPRDVVLSCYQQRFTINAAMAQFLELGRAGAYYDQVMSLFELCRERLALDVHQVRYEDVVADLDGAARALCAFLGVGFEAEMLNYRETALSRDIATPSARQVIEPLYNRSIGRWRRYSEELKPILPVLAPWAERYGYEP